MSNVPVLTIKDASFNYPGEDALFEDLKLTITKGEVTALVGVNGSGKSTLLKIIMGQLELTSGKIELNCAPYYVPQVDLSIQQSEIKIYEYISQYYEEWWDVPVETEILFDLTIDPESETRTLSGGELMKLNLAIALKNNPDFLILDEPTNHLDVSSINNLINFIKTNEDRYTFLIVSHDTFFLDQVVTRVLNLENKKITSYGGNYSFYVEQKELQLGGLRKQQAVAQAKLENALTNAQKAYEKQEHKAAKTRTDIHEGKEKDKYIIAGKKESGESTTRARKVNLEKKQAELTNLLENIDLPDEQKTASMHIKNTGSPANNMIFEIDGADLKIENKKLIKNIKLKINYGDRIAIAGNNGTGKTTLIKALLKLGNVNNKDTVLGDAVLDGNVNVNDQLKWVYIDQNYSSVDPNKTLIQNLMSYNKSYTEDMAKSQLGKFQFKNINEMNKLGKNLSGGETVRFIMAMITAFPIDMIILDEPTNNLDVETVNVLVEALNNFKGAIVVISHNIDFLNAIKITKSFLIKENKISQMNVDPQNRDDYYKALVE